MSAEFTAIVIGSSQAPGLPQLKIEIQRRTNALSQSQERINICGQGNIPHDVGDSPAVGVVFCRYAMDQIELDAITRCRRLRIPLIPVVADLGKFVDVAPSEIRDLNGFELSDIECVGELAGIALECLGLQRSTRKIFISYARRDAAAVAKQLREAFSARWYDVFLDTISIRPGAAFQEDLLQELADSDVIMLLNSPAVENRPYVQQEIAFADQAGVGGVQVMWPNVAPLRQGAYFYPIALDVPASDPPRALTDGTAVTALTEEGLREIMRCVADLRTQLQQQRENQMLAPIKAYANHHGWDMVPYLGRHVVLKKGADHKRLEMALGVPTSRDLERSFNNAHPKPPAGRLVYDPLGITAGQAAHLEFLRSNLGLQYLNPRLALEWDILP